MTAPHERLRARLGDPALYLDDPADTARYARDWIGKYVGQAPLVVRPRSTEEVAAVLAACSELDVPLVPQAGNTGMVGGGVPRAGEVVLSVERLNAIEAFDEASATVRVQAGVVLETLQNYLAERGYDMPVDLGGRGLLPDRRHDRHQRRRGEGAALRAHARAGARAGGRACRRHRGERPQHPEEEQHRPRPEAGLHRLGGHARRDHAGRAAGTACAGGISDRARRSRQPRPAACLAAGGASALPPPLVAGVHRRGDRGLRPKRRTPASAFRSQASTRASS